ncbi:hypothetical protein ELH43_08620 [Rhizobium ruizarguesonis]|uniref:hypothetical protein n=1 Tax=Rhizobium ruizarguesonis TaxID=2081791 RepID=UPI00103210A2|nr:hypothetical protein [Rhizobium ruizarguesonis]TBA25997.1 hypothetical protein ELH61_09405 [Rhizobium ruizarguesonis]TBB75446.1 hypothetical protein ELH43_08620 [Rhizobium ruizarguesonis]
MISSPTKCYKVAAGDIGAKELPVYSKALAIYVPDGATATISMVYLNNLDGEAVTRTFTAGNHYIAARIRRITAVSNASVEIHVETE